MSELHGRNMNGFDEAARSAEMVRERKTTDTKLVMKLFKELNHLFTIYRDHLRDKILINLE